MPGGVGLLRMVAWILGIFVSGLVFFKANLGDSHTHTQLCRFRILRHLDTQLISMPLEGFGGVLGNEQV